MRTDARECGIATWSRQRRAEPRASSGGSNSSGEVIGSQHSGEATHYDQTGTVNCSYEGITNSMVVATLNTADYGAAEWCGACARVHGPNGEVTVQIVDSCSNCAAGDLDLSPTAFNQLAELVTGRASITWTFATCNRNGPITYRYKDRVNEWHVELLIENHNIPIESVEWSKDGTTWTTMQRQTYNFFLESSGFGAGETCVRVTAVDGQQLADVLPAAQEYLVAQGAANFE